MYTPPIYSFRVTSHVAIFVSLLIVYLPGLLTAETILKGTINNTTFTAAGNPYVVEKEIVIPYDKNVEIKQGCRFYFKPFVGITVEGSFRVMGTPEHPVIFTSINDSFATIPSQQLPNPFDWNGIYIKSKAGTVELSNFTLSYSVYGVKSQKEIFTIVNGTFRQNGQYHCTINETIKLVAEGIPFNYGTHGKGYGSNKPGLERVGVVQTHSVKKSGSLAFLRRKEVPYILGGVGIVCGGVSLVFLKRWFDGNDAYNATTDLKEQEQLSDDGKVFSTISIAAGALSVAAITTGVVLYVWNNSSRKKVSVIPLILPGVTGAVAVIPLY